MQRPSRPLLKKYEPFLVLRMFSATWQMCHMGVYNGEGAVARRILGAIG
jgi:hypothetical protein